MTITDGSESRQASHDLSVRYGRAAGMVTSAASGDEHPLTGAGVAVAVIDSGIDINPP